MEDRICTKYQHQEQRISEVFSTSWFYMSTLSEQTRLIQRISVQQFLRRDGVVYIVRPTTQEGRLYSKYKENKINVQKNCFRKTILFSTSENFESLRLALKLLKFFMKNRFYFSLKSVCFFNIFYLSLLHLYPTPCSKK